MKISAEVLRHYIVVTAYLGTRALPMPGPAVRVSYRVQPRTNRGGVGQRKDRANRRGDHLVLQPHLL